jgi:uncharacterized Ntn-hydrolase superfamily protein
MTLWSQGKALEDIGMRMESTKGQGYIEYMIVQYRIRRHQGPINRRKRLFRNNEQNLISFEQC